MVEGFEPLLWVETADLTAALKRTISLVEVKGPAWRFYLTAGGQTAPVGVPPSDELSKRDVRYSALGGLYMNLCDKPM